MNKVKLETLYIGDFFKTSPHSKTWIRGDWNHTKFSMPYILCISLERKTRRYLDGFLLVIPVINKST